MTHSNECKIKMSKKQKERWSNPEERLAISEKRKKYFENIDNRKKQSELKKKYYEDPEALIKHSCVRQGISRAEWTGFVSNGEYCDVWKDKEYREDVLKRDNYKCQSLLCWNNSKRLVRHHIDYDKKNCKPDNLIVLCTSCNLRANKNREYWEKFYICIMKRRKLN